MELQLFAVSTTHGYSNRKYEIVHHAARVVRLEIYIANNAIASRQIDCIAENKLRQQSVQNGIQKYRLYWLRNTQINSFEPRLIYNLIYN